MRVGSLEERCRRECEERELAERRFRDGLVESRSAAEVAEAPVVRVARGAASVEERFSELESRLDFAEESLEYPGLAIRDLEATRCCVSCVSVG